MSWEINYEAPTLEAKREWLKKVEERIASDSEGESNSLTHKYYVQLRTDISQAIKKQEAQEELDARK